jgi:hypothetical protein
VYKNRFYGFFWRLRRFAQMPFRDDFGALFTADITTQLGFSRRITQDEIVVLTSLDVMYVIKRVLRF